MRIAYLDCFAGISGDMFLAALIGAGVDPAVLHSAAAAMNIGATLEITTVDRSGISSTKVNVLIRDEAGIARPADAPASPNAVRDQHPAEAQIHQHQPTAQLKSQHLNKPGHTHTHGPSEPTAGHTHAHAHDHDHTPSHTHTHTQTHTHQHGRSLTAIRRLIQDSTLSSQVQHTAIRTFELLGASEAKIHNVPVEQIHFHEVGAVDAILDIVAASAGIHALAADRWVASPINVGSGMVDCAHGRFPVPAPATADLLRGMPTYAAHLERELTTPTGAAILRNLVEEHSLTFGPQPPMQIEQIGYGAGTRNPANFPNVLRLCVGDVSETTSPTITPSEASPGSTAAETEIVAVLETALDDLSPQLIAHVAERALALGALDVMLTPVVMKKGRPGTLITLLAHPNDSARFEDLLLRETTTLGLRTRLERRVILARAHTAVQTQYGEIRMKTGSRNGEILNVHPEFEDCRRAAEAASVAVKLVHQAAIAAYSRVLQSPSGEPAA